MRVVFGAYKWFVLVPVVGISTVLMGTLCLLLCLVAPPAAVGRWCGRTWARINAFAAFMHVTVEGAQHMDAGRSHVVVANHQSQLDILLIYGWLGIDFRWVMKQELRRVPVLGICCEKLGHIFIDRSDRTTAIAAIEKAKRDMPEGASVFFFPEGTRSRDGGLLPFKKGAFRMAVAFQMPILPVSITGTYSMLPPDTLRFRPGSVRMVVHPPVETAGYGPEDVPELMRQVRETIESGLPVGRLAGWPVSPFAG
jgi:1-acyl-sn-glycerol-3-phosphate acyltransferase